MKNIVLLGSTGSIGTQALSVCENLGYGVLALCAHKNVELLLTQAKKYKPKYIGINTPEDAAFLEGHLSGEDITVLSGADASETIACLPDADIVLNAIVGMAGLRPTLAAIDAGHDVALANKETLVAGGALVMKQATKQGVRILPVDSEHSAIFQCLQDAHSKKTLRKIILTASGGPFFGRNEEELREITPMDALKHPNWDMGAKITVDSATMMNKGLELIEAVWLFGVSPEQIEIVVHRESVLHSAVEYVDHSVIGQLGVPDMKIPIQYALTYPERHESEVKTLSLTEYGTLSFFRPDEETFAATKLAREAIFAGGTAPAILNGANEAAVDLFLKGEIGFLDITVFCADALREIEYTKGDTLADIMSADKKARDFIANKALRQKGL